MKTLDEKFDDMLQDNGLWPEDADKVMELFRELDYVKNLNIYWNDDISGYPSVMLASIWYTLKKYTLSWIDENCPKAFYRHNFTE